MLPWQQAHLSDVLTRGQDDLQECVGLHFYPFLEADAHHGTSDLIHPGLLEPQVQTVVGKGTDLRVLSIVADANDGDFGPLYHGNDFLCT